VTILKQPGFAGSHLSDFIKSVIRRHWPDAASRTANLKLTRLRCESDMAQQTRIERGRRPSGGTLPGSQRAAIATGLELKKKSVSSTSPSV